MSALPDPSIAAAPTGPIAVAVLGGDAAYDMFEVVSIDIAGAVLRGPLLFEISEELGLRLTRGASVAVTRGRVTGHDTSGAVIVTTLVFIDGAPELKRFFG